MAEIREYVAFSVREQMLKHPGKKGERTYAEILHLMTEDGQYSYSNYLDDDLEKITSNFRKEVGCTQDSFSFADSNTVLKFPAEVAASMPEEKVLRQPSELNALEKTALKSNALLMGNLAQPQSTQDFVSAAIVLLKEDMVVYGDEPRKFKMVSFPDPMAYTRKSFGDRSPDLPFLSHPNTTSPHCITFMLDVKPAKEGEYTDEEIGHIVDMARELLNTVQMARRGIICGLTDGSRFQFFRVMRLEAPEIYVEASRIFTDMQGWEVSKYIA